MLRSKHQRRRDRDMQLRNGNEVITPTRDDVVLAEESGRKLAVHLVGPETPGAVVRLEVEGMTEELRLPPTALRLLVRILSELGQGNAMTLTPLRAELTTQQAADLLNVSRPHVVKLLDEGSIPSRKVGSHRRVLLEDVLAYKQDTLARRHAALDELVALGQELGMGY
jgi:excisionase family DNA binding protein